VIGFPLISELETSLRVMVRVRVRFRCQRPVNMAAGCRQEIQDEIENVIYSGESVAK